MENFNEESNFSGFLELLSNQHNNNLEKLKVSEEETFGAFCNTYNELLKNICGSDNYILNDSVENDNTLIEMTSHSNKEITRPVSSHKKMAPQKWVKKITIPEPFDLSCYTAESKRNDRIQNNSSEGHIHVRANPVPAHVHLPLFQLMTETETQDREERREQRQNKLLAEVKPFNLSEKRNFLKFKSQSLSHLDFKETKDRNCFNAVPFPKHLFTSTNKTKDDLNEELRQIRIKARAEEMLKQSSLPFSGPRILKRWRSFSMDKPIKREDLQPEKKPPTLLFRYRPAKSYLRANISTKDPIAQNSAITSFDLDKKTNPKQSPSHKTTKTVMLRLEKMNQKLEKENTILDIPSSKSKTTEKQDSIKKSVYSKVLINDHLLSSKESIRDKLRQNREYDKRRQLEYQEELQEMNERVNKIPLLIDRQSMESFRRSVERKIKQGVNLSVRKEYKQVSLQDPESQSASQSEVSCKNTTNRSEESM